MGEPEVMIQVEDLGKKYVIRNQKERGRYVALRDVLAERLRSVGRRMRGQAIAAEVGKREEFWAIQNVSFEVRPGEVVGIIGRNGAGKSTLLKILSRITEPTVGRVRLYGRVASLLEVGTGFHPELTGRENIFLNGAILGMSRGEITRKFDEIVAFAEIEKFLDTPVKRYSSGMYVRLAFAVAAHLEPEILVVDEVLAVGDASFQKKCLGKMGEVASGGRTVLFVSHNMEAVRRLTHRCLLLKAGHLEAEGLSQGIVDHYMKQILQPEVTESPNLVQYHRLHPNSADAHFSRIEVTSPGCKTSYSIPFGSPLVISLEIFCTYSIYSASVAVTISTDESCKVTHIISHDYIEGIDLVKGTNVITCKIWDLSLVPGNYLLSAGINRQVGTSTINVVEEFPAFSIVNLGETALRYRPDRPGVVVPVKVEWVRVSLA